jgi:hypothetical protein
MNYSWIYSIDSIIRWFFYYYYTTSTMISLFLNFPPFCIQTHSWLLPIYYCSFLSKSGFAVWRSSVDKQEFTVRSDEIEIRERRRHRHHSQERNENHEWTKQSPTITSKSQRVNWVKEQNREHLSNTKNTNPLSLLFYCWEKRQR